MNDRGDFARGLRDGLTAGLTLFRRWFLPALIMLGCIFLTKTFGGNVEPLIVGWFGGALALALHPDFGLKEDR